MTPAVRCSQSRSSASEAVPSLSTRLLPVLVARSASVTCRYRVARDPFNAVGADASVRVVTGGEVEDALRVRQHPERRRAADVQVPGVAEPAEQPGEVGDGAVEVEGVQGVHPGGDQGGGGGLPVVQPDPAVLQGVLLDRQCLVGVALQPGLVDHRPQDRDPVVAGGDGQVPVHERHRRRPSSWVVARATWRAFHACSRPSWTSAHSRGSR